MAADCMHHGERLSHQNLAWHFYSPELKLPVVAQCGQPGGSIAAGGAGPWQQRQYRASLDTRAWSAEPNHMPLSPRANSAASEYQIADGFYPKE